MVEVVSRALANRVKSLNDFKFGTSIGRFLSEAVKGLKERKKERKKEKRNEQGYKISKASIFLLYGEISTISKTSSYACAVK